MADDVPKDAESLVSAILGEVTAQGAPELPDSHAAPPAAGAASTADTKALVSSVLDKLGLGKADPRLDGGANATTPAQTPAVENTLAVTAEDADALIDLYFDLEEPFERDALLEQLIAIDLPVVTEFLTVMLHEDEDDTMRARSAAELARRRVPEGIDALEADLDDPDEPFFFENAVKTLCEIRGVGFYNTLHAMWMDSECDGDRRRESMLGMESLDPARALRDFTTLVESTTNIDTMLDDQIEVAMMAFVRHEYKEALPALRGLQARVLAAPLDPEERQELGEFIAEGISLLDASE